MSEGSVVWWSLGLYTGGWGKVLSVAHHSEDMMFSSRGGRQIKRTEPY